MCGDLGEEGVTEPIPIPNVNAAVLKKVIEWCTHHKDDPPSVNEDDSDSRKKTTDIEEWDQKFMQVDQEMLFEIILVRLSPTQPKTLLIPLRLPTTLISKLYSMLVARLSPT